MENQNRIQGKRGAVLLEGIIASILFLLPALFIIDLAVTGGTIHQIGYIIQKCARNASLSRGIRAHTVTGESKVTFGQAFQKEIFSGRVRKVKVTLLGERGNRLEGKKFLEAGSIITMDVKVLLSMNFLPFGAFRIFSGRGQSFERGGINGYVTYRSQRTFMVE